MAELSPMMQNYLNTKSQYKDCMLFYRLGDFYEMFFDDAIIASRELEITLTSRACGLEEKAPMCGVPYHAADTYIAKLVNKGYKVVIAEQLTEPTKGQIVERDVIKVVTAGTRAYDIAIRIKTSGFDSKKIIPCLDMQEAIKELYKTSVKKYVIANYTALEPTRNAILKEKE